MRLLLDTHIFIWWDASPDRLTPAALLLCEDPENTPVLSVASIWEMQIKQQLGKLALQQPLRSIVERQQRVNGLEVMFVSADPALRSYGVTILG